MKRTAPILVLFGMVTAAWLGAVGGCCDYDDCGWRWRCYWNGTVNKCYWVWTCGRPEPCPPPDGSPCSASDGALALDVSAYDAGDGKVDVRVEVTGSLLEPETLLSVLPRGAQVPEVLRQSTNRVWWLSGLEATPLRDIEVQLVGTDEGRSADLPPVAPSGSGCDAAVVVDATVLPEIPATLPLGEELFFYSPPAEEVLVQGENQGLFVALFPPGGGMAQTIALPEGEGEPFPLEQPGAWTVKVLLLSSDVCEPGSTNLFVVQNVEVLVQ